MTDFQTDISTHLAENINQLRTQRDELRTGIQSLIQQCRQSAVMGGYPEDLEAVAAELEELLEGKGE